MALFGPPEGATPVGQPAGGTTFTDMLNSLSGSLPDINNGIQTLAYGIGSFAKDPQRRAMYMQAAQNHQQAMSTDKRQHLEALTKHADQLAELLQKSKGDPKVLTIVQPAIDHTVAAIGAFDKDTAEQYKQIFQASAAMPAPGSDPYTLSAGQTRYGANNEPLASIPEKPAAAPSAIQEYQFAQGQGFKGTFQEWETQQKQAGAQRNSITMQNFAPRALLAGDEEMMKKAADDYTTARSILPVFDIAGKAAQNFQQTGITGDASLIWERAKSALGLDNNAPAGEALKAMQTRLGVLQRMPGSGSTSDMEMSMYMQAVPSLANTPKGNQFLATVGKKLAQRKIENYLELRKYYSAHNGDLSGFVPNDKPILDDQEKQALEGAATGGAPAPAAAKPAAAGGTDRLLELNKKGIANLTPGERTELDKLLTSLGH